MTIYMHHICDHDSKSCFQEMEEVHKAMLRLDSRPEAPLPRPPPKPPGEVYPLARACAGCQLDESPENNMRHCGGCKLTRYCSVACQKEDWARPKPTCKQIYSVTFDESEEPLASYRTLDEKRVMVRLHLPKDRDADRIQLTVALMGRDIKHSKNWLCEFCGAPARETHFQNFFWHHLDPPRLIICIHFVCDMEQAHVRAGLTTSHNMLNLTQGGAMGPMPSFDTFGQRPAGVTRPLAGSCAACERDETASAEGLMRCSRCKMTRYCGEECQRRDWKRHKVGCGMVYSVNFENWD